MDVQRFEELLRQGQDNALLRFTLGQAYLQKGEVDAAVGHLERAVAQDPHYSAAWKLYGKALAESGDVSGAADAYRRGIDTAERKGDKQAAKEMRVYLTRLEKKRDR